MSIMQEIQNSRAEIMSKVETVFAELIRKLENDLTPEENQLAEYNEIVYPITVNPAIFRGKKPTSVMFGDGQVEVKTWKMVAEEILRHCNADPEKHVALMNLRGRLSGRERVFLSKEANNMKSPKKIDENLYIETNYDAENLIRILLSQVLDAVGYDYSGISVSARIVTWRT